MDLSNLTVTPVIVYLLAVTLWLAHYMGLVKSLKERVDKLEKSYEGIAKLEITVAKVEVTLEALNANVVRLVQLHDKHTEKIS